MDLTKTLVIGGAALIGFNLYKKYQAAKSIQVDFNSIKNLGATGLQLNGQVIFNITNPTTTDLIINSFSGSITISDTSIGLVSNINPTTILAGTVTPYPINFTVSDIYVLQHIIGLLTTPVGFNIGLNAIVNVEGFNIPVIKSFSL